MAPSVSIDLRSPERRQLLRIARDSIDWGLRHGCAMEVNPEAMAASLTEPLGAFVTLTRDRALRGCIGTLESTEALALSVASSAYGAAFRDPRFPPLEADEFEDIRIEISVLSGMEPLRAGSRDELLAQLTPGMDGLLLEDRHHRSTFLPKVWEQLPEPEQFLDHLLAKAGLATNHWSPTLRVQRYATVSFGEGTPNVA